MDAGEASCKTGCLVRGFATSDFPCAGLRRADLGKQRVGDEDAERGTFVPVAARFATVGGDDGLLRIIERDTFLSTAILLGGCGGGDSILKEYAIPLKIMTDNSCQKRATVGATSEAVLGAAKVAI